MGRTKHARSVHPESIEQFEILPHTETGLSLFSTYMSSIKMDNGNIYLFYRHGPHTGDWVYQKSIDSGKTFQPVQPFLKYDYVGRTTRNGVDIKVYDTWYASCFRSENSLSSESSSSGTNRKRSRKKEMIGCQFVYHYHTVGREGKQDGPVRYNGYYIELDTSTDTWYTVDGTPIQSQHIPLTKSVADSPGIMFYNSTSADLYSKEYDGSNWRYFVLSGTFNKIGEPCLLFRRTPPHSVTMKTTQLHYWRYDSTLTRWIGPTNVTKLQNEGGENEDLDDTRDRNDNTDIVIDTKSVYFDNGLSSIGRKAPKIMMSYSDVIGNDGKVDSSAVAIVKSTEEGTNWEVTQSTTQPMLTILHGNVKSIGIGEIRNANGNAKLVVAVRYGDIKLYSRMYLVGESGIVPRSKDNNGGESLADNLWVDCYEAKTSDECHTFNKNVIVR